MTGPQRRTAPDRSRTVESELRAALDAREELGQDYADAVGSSFLARLDAEIDARVDRRLAAREGLALSRATVHIALAIGSIGLAVVFALVARELGDLGGTVATLAAWAAILAINVVHARSTTR